MTRPAARATSGSWVTTTTVVPEPLISASSWVRFSVDAASSAPVGSSARRAVRRGAAQSGASSYGRYCSSARVTSPFTTTRFIGSSSGFA